MIDADVSGFLSRHNIKLWSLNKGDHYTTCPKCSSQRKGAKKKLKCLSVRIDESGVVCNCHNCEWRDYENAKREAPAGHRIQKDQRRDRDPLRTLQRQALSRWSGGRRGPQGGTGP